MKKLNSFMKKVWKGVESSKKLNTQITIAVFHLLNFTRIKKRALALMDKDVVSEGGFQSYHQLSF